MQTQDSSSGEEYVIIAPPASPRAALRALWRALRQLYDHFFLFAVLAILLFVTLPTIVLPGLVIMATYRIARQAQASSAPDFSDLVQALRRSPAHDILLCLVWVGGTVLILLNLSFYGDLEGLSILQPLWLGLLLLWQAIAFYGFAIAAATEWRGLRRVVQYGLIFVAARPFTTLTIWIGVPLLTWFAYWLPLLLFLLPGLLALWATTLTYPYPPEQDDPEAQDES